MWGRLVACGGLSGRLRTSPLMVIVGCAAKHKRYHDRSMWVLIGAISLAIWVVLLLARGGFWRFRDVIESDRAPGNSPAPAVAAVIPARDEAGTIGQAVQSLLASRYAGPLRVFVVDDHSSDGTAEVARKAAH